MVLCFFIFFSSQVNISSPHSLIPPFVFTNFSEIDSWSVVGTAVNMKSYLRLTNSVTNNFGGVCNRIPTNFANWSITMEMKSLMGNVGDSYHLYFTKDFCPKLSDNFDGFKILINMTEKEMHQNTEFSPFYFVRGNKITKIGTIKLSDNIEQNEKLRIEKMGNTVTITVFGKNRKENYNVRLDMNHFESYYFSFYANTNEMYTDENNLVSVTTIALSNINDMEDKSEYYSSKNRKTLQSNFYQRKELKKQRRSKMILTNKYSDEIQKEKNILSGENVNIKDSFEIIKESYNRSCSTITSEYLYDYFSDKIGKTTTKAVKTINTVSERLNEIKNELQLMWVDLNTQMDALKRDSVSIKDKISFETIELAKKIHLKSYDPHQQKENIKNVFGNGSKANKVIFTICSIEFILYAIFFIYKHNKTKGFKKMD